MKTRRSKHKGKKGNAGNAKTVGKQIKTSGKKAKMKEKQAKKPAGSKQTDNVIAKGPEERFNAVWPWMVSRVCAFCMLCLCAVSRVADPVFLHGSGSGFQISLDPDPGPISAQILEQKKKT